MTRPVAVPGATPSRSHHTVTPHGTPSFSHSPAATPPLVVPLAELGVHADSDSTYWTIMMPMPALRSAFASLILSAEACGLSRLTYRTAKRYPRRRNAIAATAEIVSVVSNPRTPSGAE